MESTTSVSGIIQRGFFNFVSYLHNLSQALRWFKEVCYHLCINTRIIGETAAKHGDLYVLDLCIKFFNTYLRNAINLNDFRVVYNSLFQYRQLAESLILKEKGFYSNVCRLYIRLLSEINTAISEDS